MGAAVTVQAWADSGAAFARYRLVDDPRWREAANGITILLSGLKRQVIQVMQRTQLIERVGADNIFATEDMALQAIYERMGETTNRPLCREQAAQLASPASA